MNTVPPLPPAFETLVSAYASATSPDDRRMYLRAALRSLAQDASMHAERLALHAERMRLVMVAVAGEGQS